MQGREGSGQRRLPDNPLFHRRNMRMDKRRSEEDIGVEVMVDEVAGIVLGMEEGKIVPAMLLGIR
jgi:hypothetical protein